MFVFLLVVYENGVQGQDLEGKYVAQGALANTKRTVAHSNTSEYLIILTVRPYST